MKQKDDEKPCGTCDGWGYVRSTPTGLVGCRPDADARTRGRGEPEASQCSPCGGTGSAAMVAR